MRVHLIDGTYELFRQHFGQAARHTETVPFAATIGVVASTLQLVSDGATHVGVASDHVIESFRNDMWAGYKTSAGMDPELLEQIPLMEQALVSAGFTTWAMVEYEADDALGAAAAVADADPRVTQVLIVTPDKDLGQCVRGTRVVQYDRRKDEILDEAAVTAKFGVGPASIADYLALVGDTADGFPGLGRVGSEERCDRARQVRLDRRHPGVVGRLGPAGTARRREVGGHAPRPPRARPPVPADRHVEVDVDVGEVDDWRWKGPTAEFAADLRPSSAHRTCGAGRAPAPSESHAPIPAE